MIYQNLKICFYMPSKIIGGCEFLFSRIAKFLDKQGAKVFYIDYKDGFVKSILKNTNIEFINYKDNQKRCTITDNCIVITPITLAFKLPKFNNKNVKFLFWNLHPENLNWLKNSSKMTLFQLEKFLKILSEKNSIINQDISTYAIAEKYYSKCSKNFISALLNNCNFQIKKNLINKDELNVTWLGRLDEDKIYSVINLLDNLKNINIEQKIKVHIIGDGDSKDKIKLNNYTEYMDIDFVGSIVEENLNEYLVSHTDILFGMGTSLSEAEKLAIPAVLTFLYNENSNINDFCFVQDLPQALVGCKQNFDYITLDRKSLQEIIDYYLFNIENLSIQCRKHFEKYFLIDKNIEKFVKSCNESDFSQDDLIKIKKLINNQNRVNILDYVNYRLNKIIRFANRHHRDNNKKLLIFASSYSYFYDMKQRPNHLFEYFIKEGYEILWGDTNVNKIVAVEPNIWLYPMRDTRSIILNNMVKDKAVMSISTHYTVNNLENILIKAAKKGVPIVYEHLDDIELCSKRIKSKLEKRFKKICSCDDIIITATADRLYNQAKEQRKSEKNIIIAKNGVNLKDFADIEINNDFINFVKSKKPIIGYYGCICKEWFDFDLLEYAIKNYSDFNFVIIGPHLKKDVEHLRKYENFLCLDKMDYEELKNYSKHFSVGIIPFKINDITKSTSPCKMFEYMALGLSIVTTDLPECKNYKSCLIAHDKREFLNLLSKAVELRDNVNYKSILNQEAKANSYEIVCNKIIDSINRKNL